MDFTDKEKTLFVELQRPWPLDEDPLRILARQLDVEQATLKQFIARLREAGLVRRIGAVFDQRRLGYRSTLFAVSAEASDLDTLAQTLIPHPGITHIYLRGWPEGFAYRGITQADYAGLPTLWFTLSAPSDRFDAACQAIAHLHPLCLPAIKRYKIDVILDPNAAPRNPATLPLLAANEVSTALPSPEEQALIRRYQGDTADITHPFAAGDLPLLRRWQTEGKLRRFALLPRHRAAGFSANGMCCWQVPEAEIDRYGERLAADPNVTHCYARPLNPAFPYNLYAMIHKQSWESGVDTFRHLTEAAALTDVPARILFSTHEYKKTSPLLFPEA